MTEARHSAYLGRRPWDAARPVSRQQVAIREALQGAAAADDAHNRLMIHAHKTTTAQRAARVETDRGRGAA